MPEYNELSAKIDDLAKSLGYDPDDLKRVIADMDSKRGVTAEAPSAAAYAAEMGKDHTPDWEKAPRWDAGPSFEGDGQPRFVDAVNAAFNEAITSASRSMEATPAKAPADKAAPAEAKAAPAEGEFPAGKYAGPGFDGKEAPAAPAEGGEPVKATPASAGPDVEVLFRAAHGTAFDPVSKVDKAKMAVIEAMLAEDPKLATLSPNKFALQLYRRK